MTLKRPSLPTKQSQGIYQPRENVAEFNSPTGTVVTRPWLLIALERLSAVVKRQK